MQKEYEIVIADTSCFILFNNIGELSLLKLLFDNVVTTTTIAEEFGEVLPEWIHIKLVKNLSFQNSLTLMPEKPVL